MTGLILLVLICVLWSYMRWREKSKDPKEPPMYPGALPVLGHGLTLIRVRKQLWNFVRKAALNLSHQGGVAIFGIGPEKVYVVCDPDDALLISNQFLDKSIHYSFFKKWLGDSLLNSDSTIWKNDRKLIMPAFSHQVLANFLDCLNGESRRVVGRLSSRTDDGEFDHVPYIKQYAVDTLCASVLGIDFPEKQEYIHAIETLLALFIKRALNIFLHVDFIYNWTNLKKTQDKYIEFVNGIADKMIKNKRLKQGSIEHKSGTKKNFLDLILQLQLSTEEAAVDADLNDKRIRDHLNIITTAGIDTILSVVPVILVMIGSHEAVQETIWKELNEIFGDTSRDVTMDDLRRLVYLEAVIKESMRLITPVPFVARKLDENVQLKNYNLSAGKTCVLLLAGLNLHPMWGEDVQEFKPERWLPPRAPPNHPAAFAAFSIGRRNCIGKYYATMSMKILLVHILRNYVITADWTKMEFTEDVILRVVSGHHISLKRRD